MSDAPFRLTDYELVRALSHVEIGEAYHYRNIRTDKPAVITFVPTAGVDPDFISRQLKKLMSISHPALAPIVAYSLPDPGSNSPLTLVSAYYSDETVASWLSMGCIFANDTKSKIIVGVAEALRHLHSLGVHHGSLVSAAVTLSEGMEPIVRNYGLEFARNGPPRFSIAYNEGDLRNLDVFDYGCLLYALFTGAAVEGPGLPMLGPAIPEGFRALIGRCWTRPPDRRPSFESIVLQLLSGELALDISSAEAELLRRYETTILPVQFATRTLAAVLDAREELEATNERLTAQTTALQARVAELLVRCDALRAHRVIEEGDGLHSGTWRF
jgi:serine/threonine protein kinase